jgi:hypothetical protein
MESSDPEPIVIEQAVTTAPVSSVTVYRDRAEVNRLTKITADKKAGTYELRLTGLVESADPESIRVRTESGRCEIVEVSSAVRYRAVEAEDSGPEAEALAALEAKRDTLSERKSEVDRIKQRDKLVQGYMAKMLTAATGLSTPGNTEPANGGGISNVGTEQVAQLLEVGGVLLQINVYIKNTSIRHS